MPVDAVAVVERLGDPLSPLELLAIGPGDPAPRGHGLHRGDDCAPATRLTFEKASAIVPSKPEWLWEGWILRRALNLLTGRQGSGKTTFAAYVTAALTVGAPLPDASASRSAIRAAILSLEEPADRVTARLHAAGADLDRVLIIGDVADVDEEGRVVNRRWSLPKDIAILGELMTSQRLDLVVVDGLGYAIAGDSHNYAVVGSALAALAGEADRTGAAILGLVHPPKGASDPVTAAIGSTAWTAIPRISMVLGPDPSDETGARRVCRVAKTNYKAPVDGIHFSIANDPTFECGFIAGVGRSIVTAEEIFAIPRTPEEKGERAEACALLREILSEGAMDAKDAARCAAMSDRVLRQARKDAGVIAEAKRNDKGRVIGWTWSLPDVQTDNPSLPCTSGTSGTSGLYQVFNSVSLPGVQDGECVRLDEDRAGI
ncbi:MAG: AAA family ATPase [Acidimicrobiales bacterium]